MDRIIRLNAPLTSSQSDSSGMNCHDLYPYFELTPEMAFIYRESAATILEVAITKRQAVAATSMSISLQKWQISDPKHIKLKKGQTVTAKIIRYHRIADIFLEPIRQL